MRTLTAITVGVVVTALLAYLGLVIVLLMTIGIPLGADPAPLTTMQYAVLLAIFCGAAVTGSRMARRVTCAHPRLAIRAISAILAGGAIWGFSGPNQWPDWWGPAAALALVAGATEGIYVGLRRASVKS